MLAEQLRPEHGGEPATERILRLFKGEGPEIAVPLFSPSRDGLGHTVLDHQIAPATARHPEAIEKALHPALCREPQKAIGLVSSFPFRAGRTDRRLLPL
jgi:hypothetical protein